MGPVEWFIDQFNSTFIVDDRYMWFVNGFGNTMIITLGALFLGVVIGVFVAVIRVYRAQTGKLRIADRLCGVYLSVFRGTPVVVQLLIMYYIIFAAIDNRVLVAVLTFGINSGAYVAEIVRAGILAVDIGQTEAGRSLGLSAGKTMSKIVLPQAIKNILPALGNEFISLIKETAVAGYIGARDLAQAGEYVRSRTADPYFSLFFIAIVYFLLVLGITKIIKTLERRLRKGDRNKQFK